MAVTKVPSADVSYEISEDAGVTWKTLVCLTSITTNFESNTSEESTINCGILTSQGDAKATVDFDAVSNTTPGANEVSFKVALGWQVNKTPLVVRALQGSSGADWFYKFDATLNSLSAATEADNMHRFSGSLMSTGLIDIVYP